MKKTSIRMDLLVSIGVISVIILGLISVLISREWQQYKSLSTASEAVAAVTTLSQATIELSLERSLTQVALNLDPPIQDNINELLMGQRQKSDALFAEALEKLDVNAVFINDDTILSRLKNYLSDISALRLKLMSPISCQRMRSLMWKAHWRVSNSLLIRPITLVKS